MCRLALLEVRGTSRSGYSNCKQCGNDDDHHHYDHDDDDYNHPDLDDHNEMMMMVGDDFPQSGNAIDRDCGRMMPMMKNMIDEDIRNLLMALLLPISRGLQMINVSSRSKQKIVNGAIKDSISCNVVRQTMVVIDDTIYIIIIIIGLTTIQSCTM